jgi:hypothetical protein
MSFSIKLKKPKCVPPEEINFQHSGESHMDLIRQGLNPELIFNGEKWVYGISYNIISYSPPAEKEENKSPLINDTCSSFLREYSTSQ